jgi:membrane-bound lytic murein transglycosylase A
MILRISFFILLFFVLNSGCSTRFNGKNNNNNFDDFNNPDLYIYNDRGSSSYPNYSDYLKNRYPDVHPRKVHKKGNMELLEVFYDEVDGWREDPKKGSLEAFVRSCKRLKRKSYFKNICQEAEELQNKNPLPHEINIFFEQNFTPYVVSDLKKQTNKGLVTGYYVPMLRGSRVKTGKYKWPIYKRPRDLRKRYYTHEQIDKRKINAKVICWVDNRVERFFLHIQGSGMVKLTDGKVIGVGYAGKNGHKYRSIGSYIVRKYGIPKDKISLDFLVKWLANNPSRADDVLYYNKSFVFFKEQQPNKAYGALNVNLVPESTIAVDTKYIPLGSPIFIKTKHPTTKKSLNHLFMAQDKGGAIKGVIRADLFFGFGDEAGRKAGNMKHDGEFFILLPNDFKL